MRVLLPIDGTSCSRSALEWAIQSFDKATTQYYLLYVLDLFPNPALSSIEDEISDANNVLNEIEEELQRLGYTVVEARHIEGDPAEEICRYAEQIPVDQIVMGSHGRHGLTKLLMGSISEKVLEHCQCPVTIHRESMNYSPQG